MRVDYLKLTVSELNQIAHAVNLVVLFINESDVPPDIGDDEPGLSDEDIERLKEIKEKNEEVGANQFTMDSGDEEDED